MLEYKRHIKDVFLVYYFGLLYIMEKNKKLPSSTRKFIRKQKAQIRRQVLNVKKQEEMIAEIYSKLSGDTNNTKREETKKAKEPKIKNHNGKASKKSVAPPKGVKSKKLMAGIKPIEKNKSASHEN